MIDALAGAIERFRADPEMVRYNTCADIGGCWNTAHRFAWYLHELGVPYEFRRWRNLPEQRTPVHHNLAVDGNIICWTHRQIDPDAGWPHIEPLQKLPRPLRRPSTDLRCLRHDQNPARLRRDRPRPAPATGTTGRRDRCRTHRGRRERRRGTPRDATLLNDALTVPSGTLILRFGQAAAAPRSLHGMASDADKDRVGIGPIDIPEHLRAHYANYLSINHTPWDFRLIFALLKGPTPGGETEEVEARGLRPQAVVEVMIPANLMHGLISALQGNFEKYLDAYGPPGMDREGPRGTGEKEDAE